MTAVDLPPGSGLVGTPLDEFTAPRGARRLAAIAVATTVTLAAVTLSLVAHHPGRSGAPTQVVGSAAGVLVALLGWSVRAARLSVTRDGVRWGWRWMGFRQQAHRVANGHIYRDGIALEAKRGSWWFLSARDWDRFAVLVRQLRRTHVRCVDHDTTAPLRARLQSYGRFLDALLVAAMIAGGLLALWAA